MRPLLFLPLVLLLPACRDAKVATYRVPAEKAEPLPPVLTGNTPAAPAAAPDAAGPNAMANMANTAVPTATGDGLSWTAPAHWKPKAGSAMRKGSYAITGDGGAEADFAITAFPGDVGGDLANINRWRGQISLPPISASELASATEHIDANGLHMTFFDIANSSGETPMRIIGVSVPYEGSTWFFKLMGPDALVAGERAAFRAFIQTIQPPAGR